MYLKEITLRNIKCFQDVTLRFPAPSDNGNWCVILGDNGTGKTTLLQAIALALAGPGGLVKNPATLISQGAEAAECAASFVTPSGKVRKTAYTIRQGKNETSLLDAADAFERRSPVTRDEIPSEFVLAGYGALRRMDLGVMPRPSRGVTMTDALGGLFDPGNGLPDFDGFLRAVDYQAKDPDADEQTRAIGRYVLDGILNVVNALLPEEPQFRIKGVNSRGVTFLSPGNDEVTLYAISEGYRNVFALAVDLIYHIIAQAPGPNILFSQHADGSTFVDIYGIVLIDEVDLHLHPKWQRTIGKLLQRAFPRIQFIVATHSPFVAQTASEGGLSVLRWHNGKIEADSPLPSMHTWPAEDILLGPAFGLETTRDPEIDALLREYARLNALDLRGQLKPEGLKRLKELRKKLKGALPPAGNVYDTETEVTMLVREAQKDHD